LFYYLTNVLLLAITIPSSFNGPIHSP